MDNVQITYKISPLNPEYWHIFLNGQLWRVMHHTQDPARRYPGAVKIG